PWRNAATRGWKPFDEALLRNPITGIAACCARAVSGHATTVLLRSLMNSRRLMASPAPRTKSGIKDYHIFGSRTVPFVAPKRNRNNVRFGSKADIRGVRAMSALPPKADMDQSGCDVRFVPKADIGHLIRSLHQRGRSRTSRWSNGVADVPRSYGNLIKLDFERTERIRDSICERGGRPNRATFADTPNPAGSWRRW